jgi:deoxyadenosine/deoxycytidine kinase
MLSQGSVIVIKPKHTLEVEDQLFTIGADPFYQIEQATPTATPVDHLNGVTNDNPRISPDLAITNASAPRCILDFDTPTSATTSIRISIEGNIGCGKSSIISGLWERLPYNEYDVYEEPVGSWNEDGTLSHFYEVTAMLPKDNYTRWKAASDLQLTILKSYINIAKQPTATSKIVMERGALSSLKVFTPLAKMHSEMEAQIYNTALDEPMFLHTMPHIIIYIDVPPDVCLNRIRSRGIAYEQDVTLSYLQRSMITMQTCYQPLRAQ